MNEFTLAFVGALSAAAFISLGFLLCAIAFEKIVKSYESRLSHYDSIEKLRTLNTANREDWMLQTQALAEADRIRHESVMLKMGCEATTCPCDDDDDDMFLYDDEDDEGDLDD